MQLKCHLPVQAKKSPMLVLEKLIAMTTIEIYSGPTLKRHSTRTNKQTGNPLRATISTRLTRLNTCLPLGEATWLALAQVNLAWPGPRM